MIKQDINKLLVAGFIEYVEKATWLSPIVVVPKKNIKLKIFIDFRKLNAATKKDPYPLPFTNEVLNIVIGYEAYSFFDGYSRYHHWNRTLWSQQKNPEKQSSFGDYVLWFPKGNKSHQGKFIRKQFEPYKIQYELPNNVVLLVTIEKSETNLVLVNMNKLKPYKYMESKVQKKKHMPVYWEKSACGV